MKTNALGKIILVAVLATTLAGCNGLTRRDASTVGGATLGAVAGAILTGGSTLGAAGGAAAGGLIGNAVGR